MKTFPTDSNTASIDTWQGMDLRDYFAGRIVPIMLKNLYDIDEYIVSYDDYDAIADNAYKVADAMMKARKL